MNEIEVLAAVEAALRTLPAEIPNVGVSERPYPESKIPGVTLDPAQLTPAGRDFGDAGPSDFALAVSCVERSWPASMAMARTVRALLDGLDLGSDVALIWDRTEYAPTQTGTTPFCISQVHYRVGL